MSFVCFRQSRDFCGVGGVLLREGGVLLCELHAEVVRERFVVLEDCGGEGVVLEVRVEAYGGLEGHGTQRIRGAGVGEDLFEDNVDWSGVR